MRHVAKVTTKGRITIPRNVRDALRLEQGDTVVFEVDEQCVRLRPEHRKNVFREYAGAPRTDSSRTIAEIVAELRQQREPVDG
jgi:antitoxin PrlF